MTTFDLGLYILVLLGQTFLISIHLPRRILNSVRPGRVGRVESVAIAIGLRTYLRRNRIVAVLGPVLLIVALLIDLEQSPSPLLLAAGVYFLVQITALFHTRAIRRAPAVDTISAQPVRERDRETSRRRRDMEPSA